jgi:hypothetical protein
MNIVITEQIAKINIPDGIPQNNVMTDNWFDIFSSISWISFSVPPFRLTCNTSGWTCAYDGIHAKKKTEDAPKQTFLIKN